jgi:hypothetical protein
VTYDQWKCDPDWDRRYDPEPPECDHSDREQDLCTGEVICRLCGEKIFVLSPEDLARERQLAADAERMLRRAKLRKRWLSWWDKWWRPANRRRIVVDDDIPF